MDTIEGSYRDMVGALAALELVEDLVAFKSVNLVADQRSDKFKEQFYQNYYVLRAERFTPEQSNVIAHWSKKRLDDIVREVRLKNS